MLWKLNVSQYYYLYFAKGEFYCNENNYAIIPQGTGYLCYRYDTSTDDFAWSLAFDEPDGSDYDEDWWAGAPWANYDLKYDDGTVRVAASEPIPIYE